jgi:hypothetical protein
MTKWYHVRRPRNRCYCMTFKKLSLIIPNFCGMSDEVDMALDEARVAMRSILATNGTSRAPFGAPPAFAI